MKLIRDLKNIRHQFKKAVVSIGIFDGVHLAHQKIIREVVHQAKKLNGTSVVLTFNPHPLKTCRKGLPVSMIVSPERKVELLRQLKVNVCIWLDFNNRLANISAEGFVKHILVDTIGVKYLIVGENFRFGKSRRGTFSLLKRLLKIYGFQAKEIKAVKKNRQIVSSSKIRSFLQKGEIDQANQFLGRKFSLCGRIIKGERRGRSLGYPTANIQPPKELIPATGVYAVEVKWANKLFGGILNIGYRPTFSVKRNTFPAIEVYIFNFRKWLYGQKIEIFFVQRIRGEKKFFSLPALRVQIARDVRKAKKVLNTP